MRRCAHYQEDDADEIIVHVFGGTTGVEPHAYCRVDVVRSEYVFFSVDRTASDGTFSVKFSGYAIDREGSAHALLLGALDIAGCKGVPDLTSMSGKFQHVVRPEQASAGWGTRYANEDIIGLLKKLRLSGVLQSLDLRVRHVVDDFPSQAEQVSRAPR